MHFLSKARWVVVVGVVAAVAAGVSYAAIPSSNGTMTSTSCYVGTSLNDVWDFQYAQTFPNSGINDVEVSLLTSRVLGSASLVKLQCYDGSGAISAKNAVISAIKVGNLS